MKTRINSILLAASLFSLIGYFLPQIYFRYLDTNQYFEVYEFSTEKSEYQPCDAVYFDIHRNSHVNTSNGSGVFELKKQEYVNGEDFLVEVHQWPKVDNINFTKGEERISSRRSAREIPCSVKDGTYVIDMTIGFPFRSTNKSYTFTSDPFEIKQGANNGDQTGETDKP